MRSHWNGPAVSLPAAFPQVSDELFARIKLRFGWLITIEITDQANSQRNVVQKIAVNVTAVDLASPSIAHLDFAIAAGSAISNYEMIGQSILHTANASMVIIKHARVALPGTAVMHDDEFPTIAGYWRAPYFFNH